MGGKSLIKIVSMNFDEERGAFGQTLRGSLRGWRGKERGGGGSRHRSGSRGCWIVIRRRDGKVGGR